jgi:hypothetical protein
MGWHSVMVGVLAPNMKGLHAVLQGGKKAAQQNATLAPQTFAHLE